MDVVAPRAGHRRMGGLAGGVPDGGELQINAEFPDRAASEHTGIGHLAPALAGNPWFLMRKAGAWRCRIRLPAGPGQRATTRAGVAAHLDELTAAGRISRWTRTVYEPETRAFGGTAAMEAAHTLFCADTRHALAFLSTDRGAGRRREVSLLLCHTLMRAAGLDHYEQGDVWDRVAATRPRPADAPQRERLHRQMHHLLSVAPGPDAPHFTTGAFAGFAPWAQAFHTCGRGLADLHARGRLERGLRAVLAHHVMFHWNRLGLPTSDQAVLAHTAARAIFDPRNGGAVTEASALPPALGYIPLVPRARPPALPLGRRLEELHHLLRLAETADDDEALPRLCEVMNKAALIASDTGHPVLAESLCWRQYDLFAAAAPLTARAATFAVQPLVNLARLDIRAGRPSEAYAILKSLLEAATHGSLAQVKGRACTVAGLVATAGERDEIRQHLWAILIADGTRALRTAGRWHDVVDHLHRYKGIGHRLLDGRQVAILAALHRHDPDTATNLLQTTAVSEAWEHTVASCLATAAAHTAGHDPARAITAMADAVRRLAPTPGGASFTARVGTVACELAPHHCGLAEHVINTAMAGDDAHGAVPILGSAVVGPLLSRRQHIALRARVERAALTEIDPPPTLAEDLEAVWTSANARWRPRLARRRACARLDDPDAAIG